MKAHPFAWRVRRCKHLPHRRWNRLSFELLEDRTLLSATLPTSVNFQSLQIDYDSFESSSILVRYKDGVAGDGKALGLVSGLHEVFLTDGMDVSSAIEHYKTDPNVLYVQPNYRVQVNVIPNDPQFSSLYGLHNTGQLGGTVDADIDAPEAWDTFTGSPSVVVAVIDTGVDYNHPDLIDNIWTNNAEANGVANVDDDGNGVVDDIHGANFVDANNPTGDPFDDHGHGTHVSGTIGAVGNNGIGVAGVNWDVQIMGVKFLDAGGGGSTAGAISALSYAVRMGATISNNSWGYSGGPDQALGDAIASAGLQGHLFVAAAGNDGSNNDLGGFYPAGYDLPNVLSVAATDRRDQLASFSNYGATTVDLGAPGVDILSTLPGGYGTFSGTSMATPHVTGVAALVKGLHPGWNDQQIKAQILSTVDPIPALQGRTVTGGRLNAAAAATGTPPPDNSGPRVTATSPSGSVTGAVSSIRFTFSERIDPATFTLGDVRAFSGPSGSLLTSLLGVSEVIPSNGRQFDVTFLEQRDLGAYTITIGPEIYDVAAIPNPMNQDNDSLNGENPGDEYTGSFTIADDLIYVSTDVPAPIYDLTVTISYLTVPDNVFISDLNVTLDLTHTWDGDLYVHLVSPTGYDIPLSMFNGAGGQNFTGTIFDDEAATPISAGVAPFTGSFRPDGALSQLDGQSVLGTWQLWVEDWGFFDEGTLLGWSLIVQPGTPPPPPNEPPVAIDDYVTINEDQSVVVHALANDYDPEGGVVSIVSIDYVDGGTANITADGKIAFDSTPNYNGYGYVAYTITDPAGNLASAWVYVEILPVDDPPIAVDDFATASLNTPLWFDAGWPDNPPPPEWNDTDGDGDWLWITSVGNAVNGTVELYGGPGGTVLFTPATNFIGTASFTYTVTDGTYFDTGLVTIAVNAYYYVSTAESGTINGLSFTDADILQLEIRGGGQYSYSIYFDGSQYGLTQASEDIDAFAILSDGSILISTVGSFTVPQSGGGNISGVGQDLIQWNPWDQRFTFYFDGSDVGMAAASENIDAVAMLDDGRILVSTTGNFAAGGVSGLDEDLFAFSPYSLGTVTSGTWEMYFDGSDVGLSTNDNEDIDAVFVEPTAGLPDVYLSTVGNFAVTGASGANEDIFRFRPTGLGGNTAGSFTMKLDASAYGLANFNVDGIHIGRAMPLSAFQSLSVGHSSMATDDAATPAESTDLSAMPPLPGAAPIVVTPTASMTPVAAASVGRAATHRAAVDRVFADAVRSPSSGDDLFDSFADLGALTDALHQLTRRGR